MKKSIFIFFILFVCFIYNFSYADNNITFVSDVSDVVSGSTFKIHINLNNNIKVASYTLNIYFDSDKLEYISGSDNTNIVNNRIINLWYDETGGNAPKQNQEIATFEFKAKSVGTVNFILMGEFYDSNGNLIENNTSSLQVNITEEQTLNLENHNENSNNTELSILRLNKEGITPDFSHDIYEYYITITSDINSFDITAIPQVQNAKVDILGNENFSYGLNIIKINVSSADDSSLSTYTIYVTKTDDLESANTNLEILAIENNSLEPLFDTNVLSYYSSVSNDTKNINIFAVPENINGKVEIKGDVSLKEGDNNFVIKVTAPNGFSFKNYNLLVHRRSSQEDVDFENQQEINTEKLDTLLEEKAINSSEIDNINNENSNTHSSNLNIFFVVLGLIFIAILVLFLLKKFKTKKSD